MPMDIIERYDVIDEFYKLYEMHQSRHLLPNCKQRNRVGNMSISEMVTIMVLFPSKPLYMLQTFLS